MSIRTEVLLWAQRVLSRPTDAPPHVLLEVSADASVEDAQEAFHKIARSSHPDLHRASVDAAELESITSAYARVAGAYQDLRTKRMQTTRMRAIRDDLPVTKQSSSDRIPAIKPAHTIRPGSQKIPVTPSSAITSPAGPGSGVDAPMNSRASIYYRKATLALRQGDLKAALLNMKMAIAGDPQSAFLRNALAEIEAELGKK